jgi:hypothetical protein
MEGAETIVSAPFLFVGGDAVDWEARCDFGSLPTAMFRSIVS